MISYYYRQCLTFTLSLTLASLSFLVPPVTGSEAFCDSLLSYNQYSILLKDAPRCLGYGCGGVTPESFSSSYDMGTRCNPFWRLINEQHQSYHSWCDYCHDSPACRIPGWPVLNVLAVCDSVHLLELGNTSTQCCSSITERDELRGWFDRLCDGSWKSQFSYYGGLAAQDWEEWILPLNWTVPYSNTGLEYPGYPSYIEPLQLVGMESFAFAASFVLAGSVLKTYFPAWNRLETSPSSANKIPANALAELFLIDATYWSSLILLPTILVGMELASNFVAAYVVQRSPDYQSVLVPHLALLFSTRPRLSWILLAQFMFPDRFLPRFWGLCFSKRLKGTSEIQQSFKTATFSILVAKFVDQLAGGHLLATTVSKIGFERGFYLPGRLLPYAGGRSAALMYFSAFIWLLAEFSFVVTLTVLTYYQRRTILNSLRQVWPRILSRMSEAGKDKSSAEYHRETKLVTPSIQRSLEQSHLPSDSISNFQNGFQSVEKEQEKVHAWGVIRESDSKGYIGSHLVLILLVVSLLLYCAQWVFWAGWIGLIGQRLELPESHVVFHMLKPYQGYPPTFYLYWNNLGITKLLR